MAPGFLLRTANAPSTTFAPSPHDQPMPVETGTKRSKTPLARKNASRARLRSRYQSSMPSAYIQVRTTDEKSMPKSLRASARFSNAEMTWSRGEAPQSAGPTPLTSA